MIDHLQNNEISRSAPNPEILRVLEDKVEENKASIESEESEEPDLNCDSAEELD